MDAKPFEIIRQWSASHPGIFSLREDGKTLTLRELYSQKDLTFHENQIQKIFPKQNSLKPQEDYLLLLLESGGQLALSAQGFAFPPDFTNTGPLPLPSQVYCMRDFEDLLARLRGISGEAGRKKEALDLVMVLIAILDGAKAIGLDVSRETQSVDTVLTRLEKGDKT